MSLENNLDEYKLICYTNFNIGNRLVGNYNIEYKKYYDNSKIKLYDDAWLNLSFNKINIYIRICMMNIIKISHGLI